MNKRIERKIWAIDEAYIAQSEIDEISRRDALLFEAIVNDHGTCIIGVDGAQTDAFSYWFQSYRNLRASIEEAVIRDSVERIVLYLNSPGGSVSGLFETCDFIRKVREKKPIFAYGQGLLCSAAYAIAASTGDISVSDATETGSIGVMAICERPIEEVEELKDDFKIVRSSNAENKNLSPFSEGGEKKIKSAVDYFEGKFFEAIEKGIGVEKEDILQNFGHGETFIGQELLSRKMVQHIEEWDEFLARIENREIGPNEGKGDSMDIKQIQGMASEERIALYAELLEAEPSLREAENDRAKAMVAADRERISALLAIRTGATASVIDEAIKSGKTAAEVGLELYKAQLAFEEESKTEANEHFAELANASQDISVPSDDVGSEDSILREIASMNETIKSSLK